MRYERTQPNHTPHAAATSPAAFPTRPMTMLGVWAHPDDESYLSAVLMSRVLKVGGRVVLATATRGEAGGLGDPDELGALRERELRAAMSSLCVRDVRLLGYADGQCSSVDPERAVDSIVELIEDVRPDIIVTFGPDGITSHPDHIAVSKWTTAAAASVGHERLLYATMTDDFVRRHDVLHSRLGVWMGDEPRTVAHADLALHLVPTPRERELKGRALRAHASQVSIITDLIGAEAFDGWWVDEYFRRPTPDEWAAASSLETACLVA
jgi:LmbE family N-acetylglucosaminyl deacetylase